MRKTLAASCVCRLALVGLGEARAKPRTLIKLAGSASAANWDTSGVRDRAPARRLFKQHRPHPRSRPTRRAPAKRSQVGDLC